MEFKKFNTITPLHIEREAEMTNLLIAFGDYRCAVMEKVHGSNFSVETDGTDVDFSRRTGKLEPDSKFYGYQFLIEPLTVRIKDMFDDVRDMNATMWEAYDLVMEKDGVAQVPNLPRELTSIKITGEFCGGHFPETPVCAKGAGQVGKGKIWYSQIKTFLAFELEINGEVQDIYTMASLCQSFAIPTVPVLFFGTFQECLEFSKEHLEENSVVSTMFPLMNKKGGVVQPLQHLPLLDSNVREGHVIIPVKPQWFHNGKRMALKHKSKGHTENSTVKVTRLVEFTEEQQYVYDEVYSGITEARLESVCSKEVFVLSDMPKVMDLVVEDSIEECWNTGYSVFAAKWQKLNTKQRKQVTKRLNREATLKLRKAFMA